MGTQPVFDVFRTVTGAEPKVPWPTRLSRTARVVRVGGRKAGKATSRALRSEGERGGADERR